MTETFKTGDPVIIETDDRRVEGEVVIASENSVSLVLQFEAMLHGHVGLMPVLRHDDGSYRSLIGNHHVAIRKEVL